MSPADQMADGFPERFTSARGDRDGLEALSCWRRAGSLGRASRACGDSDGARGDTAPGEAAAMVRAPTEPIGAPAIT